MTQLKQPTVSIIVPVYNTEKYVLRCLKSISESTFNEFEVLVVDDGSTDSSPSICDEFAQMDSRFMVFHSENMGVSHARNLGLDNAKGKYIVFIDSDDEIGKDRIKCLVEAEPCDMIFGRYTNVVGEDRSILCYGDIGDISIDQYREILNNNKFLRPAVVWNGCYLRQIIEENHLRFELNKIIGEDNLFNMNYLECCQTVRFIDNCEYYYSNIKTSTINQFHQNITEHEENELRRIEQFCRTVNYRNRFFIWHKAINYYKKWQGCDDSGIRTIAKKENIKCYRNAYFRESIPYIRNNGTVDEKIETYLMGYYRHKLFDSILKILKAVKG